MPWSDLGDFPLSASEEWIVSRTIQGEIYRISHWYEDLSYQNAVGVVAPVFVDENGDLNIFQSEAQRFIYQNFYDVKCLPSFLGSSSFRLGFKRLDKGLGRWVIKAESFRAISTEDNIGNTIRFAWRNLSVPDIIQQFPRLQAEKERVAMQFPLDLIEISSPVVVLPVRELAGDKKTRQSLYLQNAGNDRVLLKRLAPGQSLSDAEANPVITYLEPGSSYSETDDTVSGIVAFCEDGDNTVLNRSEYMYLPWQEAQSVNSVSSSPNPSAVGANVTFSATMPGVADDFKLIKIGANNEWETQIQVLNGTGTATGAPSLPVGSYPLRLTHTSGEVIAESEFVVVA